MSDVFISYARATERHARLVAEVLRTTGFDVWRDDELPAHRAYSDVIEERIRAAKAVLVIWSQEAAKSQWVRAEADAARELGTLVQMSIDGTTPPMPFNQIQCADLRGWDGDIRSSGWQKVEGSVASLAGARSVRQEASQINAAKTSVCVLPFVNMSGDAEQEYFSDGISEDIITDLSKISALEVVARNTAFGFKGQVVKVKDVARELDVTHVLEGSVRKSGDRVRITAQLVDGATSRQLWAERYDRDLTDIFAIQDEISKAIVGALQLTLLPKEKKAIEHRGTSSAEAYNLYLMARQQWITGNFGDSRRDELIVRICQQAVALDPAYAQAWGLMALAQCELKFRHERQEDALAAAEKALALDPRLAEGYCVRARYLSEEGRHEEANKQIDIALELAPDSWEVNREAGRQIFKQGRPREAIPFFEQAVALMKTDYHNGSILITCYQAVGDKEGVLRAAQTTLERAEKAVAQDASNGAAVGYGAFALAALGDPERAKEWTNRALLIAPDNLIMRYNLGCALAGYLSDRDAAISVLEPYFQLIRTGSQLRWAEVDPDLDSLRDDPRFERMLKAAQTRLRAVIGAEGDECAERHFAPDAPGPPQTPH